MRVVLAQLFADGFSGRVQIVAVVVTAAIFAVILELVRRRRLVERYALLWMAGTAALLVLAIWRGLLDTIASALGVADPPNALFLTAFAVVFLLLLHFSVAISRLSEETKILAQESARLDQELRRLRASMDGHEPAPPGEDQPAPGSAGRAGAGEPPTSASASDQ